MVNHRYAPKFPLLVFWETRPVLPPWTILHNVRYAKEGVAGSARGPNKALFPTFVQADVRGIPLFTRTLMVLEMTRIEQGFRENADGFRQERMEIR